MAGGENRPIEYRQGKLHTLPEKTLAIRYLRHSSTLRVQGQKLLGRVNAFLS